MTDADQRVRRAFDAHDAYESTGEGHAVTTTVFDATVRAGVTDREAVEYVVTVRAPMLSSAVEGDVGPAVEEGWFDTYGRRLEDVTTATRRPVELTGHDLCEEGGDAVATFRFEHRNPEAAAEIAKTVVEYVEGTYVEGVVPGYDYRDPVASLLSRAASDGEGERGGTPL